MAKPFGGSRINQEEDDAPYSALSTRAPLQDPTESLMDDPVDDVDDGGEEMAVPAPVNPVKAAIAQRMASKGGPSVPPGMKDPYANEGAMQELDRREAALREMQKAQIQSNLATNMAAAGATMAQGSNAPKANNFDENIAKQDAILAKGTEDSADRRQKVIAAIEGRKGKETIAKSNAESRALTRKALQENRNMIAGDRQKRLDNANIRAANNLLSNQNITKETTKLNAARGVQSLIDAIKGGEIKDSKNIRNQLTNMIATIEMGGPGAVSDRHEMGVDNLYTRAKDALSFMTSNPQSSIPPAYLDQLEHEGHALGDRAAQNYKALADKAMANADLGLGDPEADQGMVYKLAKQSRDKFLSGTGYDPETGMRAQKGGKEGTPGMTAPQEAAATPVRMMAPDGTIRLVPGAQVEAAIKAGGKRVN